MLTVTANDRTKTYGDALALGTTAFGTSGLKNSDSVTDVTLTSDGTSLTFPARGDAEPTVFELAPVHEFGEEIGHFAHSILDGTRPLHTQKEGIEVLGIILAAYQSARDRTIAPVRSVRDLARTPIE